MSIILSQGRVGLRAAKLQLHQRPDGGRGVQRLRPRRYLHRKDLHKGERAGRGKNKFQELSYIPVCDVVYTDACVKAAAVVTTGSRRSTALFAIGRGAEQIKAPTMPGNPVMKSDDSQCCGSSTQNSSACIALLRHQCG